MNSFKTLALGAVVLSVASLANADTTFRITGSTAFRAATIVAIQQAIDGTTTVLPTAVDNSTVSSGNNFLWTGSNGTLGNYVIKASFNGSAAGIQTIAGGVKINFFGSTGVSGTDTNTADLTDAAIPDATMSDVFQASSPFAPGVVKTRFVTATGAVYTGTWASNPAGTNASYVTYNDLSANDQIVAIVTFKPVASKGFPLGAGSVNNTVDLTGTFTTTSYSLTAQNYSSVFANGGAPLSFFTGLSTDGTSEVYGTGRNLDSGTRITTLAETGFGISNPVVQYIPTFSGSNTVTALVPFPRAFVQGVDTAVAGNSGGSSGGTVRGYLVNPFDQGYLNANSLNAAYLITVLGTSDTASVAGSVVEMPYNGVVYSENAVINGQYTMWGYEHMLTAGTPSAFAAKVVTNIRANGLGATALAKAGIASPLMQVQRTNGDGSSITNGQLPGSF
jgi:hypothetical protein